MTERDSQTGRFVGGSGGGGGGGHGESIVVRELLTRLGFTMDGSGLEKAQAAFTSLAGMAAGLVAAVIGAKVALSHLAESAAEAGADAYKAGLRMGTTAEEAQKLAFSQSHTTEMSSELSAALFRLQHNAEAARKAGKSLGFETLDKATGRVKPLVELSESLADKMVSIQDPAERADLAFRVLGRGSQTLIPWLLKGRDGIEELGQEAEDLGAIISDKDAKAGKEFVDVMHALHTATGAVWRRLGTALIPIFKELAERQIELFKTMRPLIDKGIKVIAHAVETTVHSFFKFKDVVKDHTRLLAIMGGVLTAYLIPSIVRLGVVALLSAAKTVLAWAAAAAPFIALGLAIGAIALILEDVWVFATGGKSLLGELIDTFVKPPIDPNEHWLVTILRNILGTIKEAQGIVDRLMGQDEITKDMTPEQARAAHKRDADMANNSWQDAFWNIVHGQMPTQFDVPRFMPAGSLGQIGSGVGPGVNVGSINMTVNAATGSPEDVGKAAIDGTKDAFNQVLRRTNDNLVSPVKR